MSYEQSVAGNLRTPLTVVKLDLDNGVTDADDICHTDGNVPLGTILYPSIKDVRVTPLRATPLKGLGYRGQVTVSFVDFPHGDKGTYFGKLIGSNPFYLDRHLKLYNGFYTDGETFTLDNFKERLYFIKEIDGPNDKGIVTIKAVDILSKLDSDQAIVPQEYNVSLTQQLSTADQNSIFTDRGADFPNTSIFLRIADQIVRASGGFSDEVNLLDTAQLGTTFEEAEIGEAVVLCYVAQNINIIDVIYELIADFTDINESLYINKSEWDDLRDNFFASDNVTVIITESTPVKKVLEELTEQSYTLLYWDDEEQLIRIKSLGPNIGSTRNIDYRSDILYDNHKITTNQKDAINEVWVYYARRDFTKDDKKAANFQELYIRVDADAGSALGVRKVKKIYASYVISEGMAVKIASRYLAQNREGSRTIDFSLDPVRANLRVGDIIDITSDLEQDSNGDYVTRNYLIIEKNDKGGTVEFKGAATGFAGGETSAFRFIAPSNVPEFTLVDEANQNYYGFIAFDNGEFSTGDPAHLIL